MPLRRLSARRFWGIVCWLTCTLGMGYLIAMIGPLDQDEALISLVVTAAWWGIWAFPVWLLGGLRLPWHR